MGNAMFGEQKTQKQIIREQKRMVERSVRALERDRQSLERDEKKLIAGIKKAAKANQMKSVKIQAKDLVRIRKHQEKFVNLTAQLRAISLQMTSMASTAELSQSMRKVTRSMQMMNQQLNLPQLQQVMREFAKQTESLDMKNEVIGDTIDDAMDTEDNETESDEIVAQVLDEIGVSMSEGLVDVPGKKQKATVEAKVKEPHDKADAALESRLNNLNGN